MTDINTSLADDLANLGAREKKMPKVRTTSSTMEPFAAQHIIDSLMLEAHLFRADAQLVAMKVMDRIVASGIKFLSGPLIREMCNSVLAELGLEKERILYTRVGIPMYDLDLLINDPGAHTSNANLMRNPETIAKLVHDQVMEQHTYLSIPPHLADAHLKGDIYIKDREYFSTRDYCATWDMRQVLLLGIAPDGLGGMHSSAAGPAQHLPVAVNHSAIWLAAAQSSFSITPEQEVLVSDVHGTRLTPIGPLVDRIMSEKPSVPIPQVNGELVDITGEGLHTYAFNPETLRIEQKEVNRVIRHPISEDVYTIHTRTGRTVRCTGTHSLFTLGNGNIKEIAVADLQEMDLIAIPRRLPSGEGVETINLAKRLLTLDEDKIRSIYVKGIAKQLTGLEWWEKKRDSVSLLKVKNQQEDIDLSKARLSFAKSSFEMSSSVSLTREMARFLGYFAAEGHIQSNQSQGPYLVALSFGAHETSRIEDAKECIRRVWGCNIGIQHPHDTETQLVMSNKLMALVMVEVLGTGHNSKDKRIPPVILSASEDMKWEFLNGYFCDGHVHRRSVAFTSVTKGLSSDLLYLLLQLGIIGRQKGHSARAHLMDGRMIKASEGYRTSIYGREKLELFAEHVPDISMEDFEYKTTSVTSTSAPDAIPIERIKARELIDRMGVPHTHSRITRINAVFQKEYMAPQLLDSVLVQLTEFPSASSDCLQEIESMRLVVNGDLAFDISRLLNS
jgi:hypothetical protein